VQENESYERYTSSIIIAPSQEKDEFLLWRSAHPSFDFTIYSPEEVISLFSYDYDYRAVRFLLTKGHSYNLACDELKAIACLDKKEYSSPKLDSLISFRDELLAQGLLSKKIYPYRSFENKDIIYHDLVNAIPLSDKLGEGHNMSMSFDLQEEQKTPAISCYKFEDKYEEAHYLLNVIAGDVASGTSPSNIYLAGVDENEAILLGDLAPLFHLRINLPSFRTLFESNAYHLFRNIYLEKGLEEALSILSSSHENSGDLRAINAFSQQFEGTFASKEEMVNLFDSIALTKKAGVTVYSPAINVLDGYFAPKGSHVYILNFAEGLFPSSHRDTDYLSDKEKDEVSLYTSLEENAQNSYELNKFISSKEVVYLSYHLSPDGKTLPAPLLAGEHPAISTTAIPPLNKEYGEEALPFFEASLLDKEKFLGEKDPRLDSLKAKLEIPYGKYVYFAEPISLVQAPSQISLSASSLKKFYTCTFAYFLSYLLDADSSENNFGSFLGNVAHKIFQRLYDDDFSFDKVYQEACVSSLETYEKKLTAKEEVLLIKIKKELEQAVNFYKAHESPDKMKLTGKPRTEYHFELTPKEDPSLSLNGSIDKVVITGDKYLTLVDYKTSTQDYFDEKLLPYGLSLQLPLYSYVASVDHNFKDKTLLGLFIGHVLDSNPNSTKEKNLLERREKFYKLDGVFLDSKEGMSSLDATYAGSDFIKGCNITNDGEWSKKGNRARDEKAMKEYGEQALKFAISAEKEIRKGAFPINPKKIGSDFFSCKYCPFQDVCYRKEEDIPFFSTKKKGSSDGVDEDEGDDENE
jgi:hypothetical protein